MANEVARRLRKTMTPQEVKLWVHLRSWRKGGYHFRRQSPREKYIVDFVCMRQRLVIEVDGGQHNKVPHRANDLRHDEQLNGAGFRVLRFWNHDVGRNLPGVLHEIDRALTEPRPHLAAHSASKTRVNALTGGHPPPSGEE